MQRYTLYCFISKIRTSPTISSATSKPPQNL